MIGHYRDPVHPFSDSDMLVRELPGARLVEASSILELRLTPERLTSEIVAFVERCFKPPRASGRPRRAASGSPRSARTRRRPLSVRLGRLLPSAAVSHRREQKERLRREREERERQARAAAQRKKMVGYGIGGGSRSRP